jgi:hypothetical protein
MNQKQLTKQANFVAEFEALLKKYAVEISVEETTHGYERYASGIRIEFDGEYMGEEYVIYDDIRYGTTIGHK